MAKNEDSAQDVHVDTLVPKVGHSWLDTLQIKYSIPDCVSGGFLSNLLWSVVVHWVSEEAAEAW